MPNSLEIYTTIRDYIDGSITAAELVRVLAPTDRYIFEEPRSELARALTIVQAAMSDRDNGQRDAVTRRYLQGRLRAVIGSHTVPLEYAWAGRESVSGSTGVVTVDAREQDQVHLVPWLAVDSERQAEPV